MLLVGIGLGWMIGMSVSPVIGTVVGSLLALLISIVSLLAGLPARNGEQNRGDQEQKKWLESIQGRISVLPLVLLILGMVGGEIIGVYCRTHQILSPAPKQNQEIKIEEDEKPLPILPAVHLDSLVRLYSRWGVDSTEIALRILEFQLGEGRKNLSAKREIAIQNQTKPVEKTKTITSANTLTGLFSDIAPKDCIYLCTKDATEMRRELGIKSKTTNPEYKALLKLSDQALTKFVFKECNCKTK